ncbi:peptide/nickel transport system ATP-binding protein [Rubritalea squalenifaciens DSM 18772]|uniref:Peptide/nickel transport system ATP-binding protein n=1 Tax=Rubritalea squalenifaciens DSM 18772 TaxID=1123071 RepID=A0A1M6M5F6_9BACT|nr:ABC transporter ATP-binding protein [Rubritalea squalenifaciens]SHJ78701.1 peptide/nickel transport system ATP-binding protein [Rubritalea squalenifaciens DSM 18772]
MGKLENILEVKDLVTEFKTDGGWLRAVDGVSFNVPKGKTIGIVGESGCGKSVTSMSIVDLLPKPMGHVRGGEIFFKGRDIRKVPHQEFYKIRGGQIGVIFQEPMTALNPVHKIGRQLMEVLLLHRKLSKQEARERAIEILDKVGIPAPERRVDEYPHQLSGGMRQRVVIAMALACKPDLIIADEPTTALDVTVQAEILDLINSLQKEMGMSVIMITHDLGVIAETCDEVVVMYAGRVVERGPVREIFKDPTHDYTRSLLKSIPSLDAKQKSVLATIPGTVASINNFVEGCRFCQRMERNELDQQNKRPAFIQLSNDHWVEDCPVCNAQHQTVS